MAETLVSRRPATAITASTHQLRLVVESWWWCGWESADSTLLGPEGTTFGWFFSAFDHSGPASLVGGGAGVWGARHGLASHTAGSLFGGLSVWCGVVGCGLVVC